MKIKTSKKLFNSIIWTKLYLKDYIGFKSKTRPKYCYLFSFTLLHQYSNIL